MSLKKIKGNFDKIKKSGADYFSLDKERNDIETKIKGLKSKYKEGGVGKDVFSTHNKKLLDIKKKMDKIKTDVLKLSQGVNEELERELGDVIS